MNPKSIQLPAKYVSRINNYLNSHKAAVGDGKTLSEIMFCALTGIDYISATDLAKRPCKDQMSYYQRKANRLSRVNRVLATRGLQLKSSNYCTTFTFTADVDYAISRNETLAINAGIRNGVLMTGRKVHRGVWSKLTKSEAEYLVHGYK